jgi:hypothetical protein
MNNKSTKKRKWIIKDWMGNILFHGKTFDFFEDGWSYIYENDPMPEENSPEWVDGWYDDYYVKKED